MYVCVSVGKKYQIFWCFQEGSKENIGKKSINNENAWYERLTKHEQKMVSGEKCLSGILTVDQGESFMNGGPCNLYLYFCY